LSTSMLATTRRPARSLSIAQRSSGVPHPKRAGSPRAPALFFLAGPLRRDRNETFRIPVLIARDQQRENAMTKRAPPVPPPNRSTKGPTDRHADVTDHWIHAENDHHDNLKEQGQSGNIVQNTFNKGHQQNR